jgi:hypothetical protein
MNEKYVTYVLVFVVILGTGFWLARLGKPYNVLIQTVHKLVGFGAFVYLIYFSVQQHKTVTLSSEQMGSLIVTSICFIAMIATGGMLATEQELPDVVLITHKVAPYLTLLSTGLSLFLLGY